MDFYNSIKPLLLGLVVIIAGSRAIKHYSKNEGKDMWVAIGVGALVYFLLMDRLILCKPLVVF